MALATTALLLAAAAQAAPTDSLDERMRRIGADAGIAVPGVRVQAAAVPEIPAGIEDALSVDTDWGCGKRRFEEAQEAFKDPGMHLQELVGRIKRLDPSPIRVHFNRHQEEEAAGMFDNKDASITIFCIDDSGIAGEAGFALRHELAHLYMFRAYGNKLPAMGRVDHHESRRGLTSPGSAWVEGFAEAVESSLAVDRLCRISQWDCPAHEREELAETKGPDGRDWLSLSWREKIANETFVKLVLLSAMQDPAGIDQVLETVRNAKEDAYGRHDDLEEFLRSFVRRHPEAKARIRGAIFELRSAYRMPAFLYD